MSGKVRENAICFDCIFEMICNFSGIFLYKIKNIFVEGAISPNKIAESIGHHQSKTKIGAHNIFLGQVRADEINGKTVNAIDYSAQKEIANQLCHEIRESAFSKHDLRCMHIYHSLGRVNAGEISFFVFGQKLELSHEKLKSTEGYKKSKPEHLIMIVRIL